MTAYPWSAMLTALTNYQVDKLKVLADSLASSSSKAEQRILEHRFCFWNCFPVKYFVMALRQSRLNKMYFILGCLLRFYSLVETLFPLPYITCSQFLFIIKDSVQNQLNFLRVFKQHDWKNYYIMIALTLWITEFVLCQS